MLRRRVLIGAGIAPLLPLLSGKPLAQVVVDPKTADFEPGDIHIPPAARI
jgi:hypothetical protein